MKYRLTDEKHPSNPALKRIQATNDFLWVRTGDLGGWIEAEFNLSHEGNCWVADEAVACERAVVSDDALVCHEARVSGLSTVCGSAEVTDRAVVSGGAFVGGQAFIRGDSVITGNSVVR